MSSSKGLQFGGVIGGVVGNWENIVTESKRLVVRPGRFERPTFCSGGKRSIQLSYGRTLQEQFIMPKLGAASSVAVVRSQYRPFHEPERWLSGRKQRFAKPS